MVPGSDLSIHNENSYASGQKKRPRGPRSTLRTVSIRSIKRRDPEVHRPLVDLKTKAIIYFSDFHLRTLNGTSTVLKGITNDILHIWKLKGENPILELSVSSVALAVFSRTQQEPLAALEASTKYNQLLRLQQRAITSLNELNVDACLIAIFFMGRFEDIVYSPTYPKVQHLRKLQSFSHHDGALAILKYWKQHLSQNHPATDIIKYSRRGMIRSATLRGLGLPSWMLDGNTFGERGLDLEYDSIAVRIVNVRHKLLILLKDKFTNGCTNNDSIFELEELREEAFDLDKALQNWASFSLSTEGYQRHDLSRLPSLPAKYFYSPIAHSYSNPTQASGWILYYATRMLISSTLLRIFDLMVLKLGPAANDQRINCLKILNKMSNDLAARLPYSLQRISMTGHADLSFPRDSISINADDDIKPYVANIIIWPLSLAANMSGVDIKHKTWFTSLLARLGRITGTALLESAETNSWPEL